MALIPCQHATPQAESGKPHDAAQCWYCWLFLNRDDYNRHWGGGGVEKEMPIESPPETPAPEEPAALKKYPLRLRKAEPCVFLRGDTGERRDCAGCGAAKDIPVYGCARHGRCARQRLLYKEGGEWVEMPNCLVCKDYKPQGEARKVTLWNPLSPGDCVCMSGALECLHEQHPGAFLTAVDTPCNDLFENNPHVVPADDSFERIRMEYPLIHQSGSRPVHFLQGYVDFLRDKLGVPLELTTNRPHLHLSDEEKGWKGRVEEILGEKKPYWLINSGVKRDYTAKGWGFTNYQNVVWALKGKIQFVQVGASEHPHPPLEGVINQVGKTSIRELIRLAYHADGVLCGTTFLMHVAAALEKPAVVVAGGREPRSWNTYPKQVLLSSVGSLACCAESACWRSRTVRLNDGDEKDKHLCEQPVPHGGETIPKCMKMIRPQQVVEAILGFYEGGVLA